ncbi:class I SAM-dependent methyltransferase [Nocardia amamiensis]|uniref:class I SAM-dependent methyltransferase n=1 Tax=Nocardia amamiensis TaxID=404578 RepID=UPI000A012B60|nr:class I SAM-dependent methyltransferase [Nocardia amamiensis]
MPATPFTDPHFVAESLYSSATRLTQRTRSLHTAKISGEDAAATIVELAAQRVTHPHTICDIGCGRGTTTLRLAADLRPRRLLALDRSQALLDIAAARTRHAGHVLTGICADFHRMPLPSGCLSLAVAAFCLYHSPHPQTAVAEIARCLEPDGTAVLVTKSADSYAELDEIIATTGLDTAAATRPSLYQAFHSGNAARIVSDSLTVDDIVHQRHEFRFDSLDALAAYVTTSPKYLLPEQLRDPTRLAGELRRRIPDRPVAATSTVTYVVAVAP